MSSLGSAIAELERAQPRHFRDPIPIPAEAPIRQPGTGGTAGTNIWPWLVDPENGWPVRDALGTLVTERVLEGIPAAWRCLTFISNAVASCAPPIEFDAQGVRVDPLSSVVERPWVMMGAHEFWAQAVSSALLYGNFLGINIDLDPLTGFPRQIMPVHPSDVLLRLEDGLPVYTWAGQEFEWWQITHVRGHTAPGSLWGLGVVEAFRQSLANAVDLESFGSSTYASAAENSVVIQVDRPELSQSQADGIQTQWITRHGSGVRRPAVIPRSMTITPLAFSPADAQFLESRQFSVAEIAFMFQMDPTDLSAALGAPRAMTYANREQREIERLTHSVGPWMRRFEETWSNLLPGRRSIAFNVERLLRTDTSTRIATSVAALGAGIFTPNDARGVERLPLFPEPWADEPFGRPPASESAGQETDTTGGVDTGASGPGIGTENVVPIPPSGTTGTAATAEAV